MFTGSRIAYCTVNFDLVNLQLHRMQTPLSLLLARCVSFYVSISIYRRTLNYIRERCTLRDHTHSRFLVGEEALLNRLECGLGTSLRLVERVFDGDEPLAPADFAIHLRATQQQKYMRQGSRAGGPRRAR